MRVLITGARGFLGGHLWPTLRDRHQVVTVGRMPLPESSRHIEGDLDDDRVLALLSREEPEAVVHLAASTDADLCEEHPAQAESGNAELPARLASAVARSCVRFLQVSTDLVFDGERAPYGESDRAAPVSVYGRTKLAGERAAADVLGERVCVARLALVYGPRATARSRPSFLERLIVRACRGDRVPLFEDEFRTPLYVEDAASALALLLERPAIPGVLHLGGPERCSRLSMGLRALAAFGVPPDRAEPKSRSRSGAKAPRPRDVSLSSSVAASLGLQSRSLSEGLSSMRLQMERRGFMVGSEIAVPEENP
ncbi:MAG TPA: SDR family oxidoreductase [Vicinamibacteria bacterium]|nr:SDR family oxidoreductase [Vicinamibacteria bacterium]